MLERRQAEAGGGSPPGSEEESGAAVGEFSEMLERLTADAAQKAAEPAEVAGSSPFGSARGQQQLQQQQPAEAAGPGSSDGEESEEDGSDAGEELAKLDALISAALLGSGWRAEPLTLENIGPGLAGELASLASGIAS